MPGWDLSFSVCVSYYHIPFPLIYQEGACEGGDTQGASPRERGESYF